MDELGGLREAIRGAKEAAGMPPDRRVRILRLPRPRNVLELALFGPGGQVRLPSLWDAAGLPPSLREVRAYVAAFSSLRNEVSLCIMPAAVVIR